MNSNQQFIYNTIKNNEPIIESKLLELINHIPNSKNQILYLICKKQVISDKKKDGRKYQTYYFTNNYLKQQLELAKQYLSKYNRYKIWQIYPSLFPKYNLTFNKDKFLIKHYQDIKSQEELIIACLKAQLWLERQKRKEPKEN